MACVDAHINGLPALSAERKASVDDTQQESHHRPSRGEVLYDLLDRDKREVERYRSGVVALINDLEPTMRALSDAEITQRGIELRHEVNEEFQKRRNDIEEAEPDKDAQRQLLRDALEQILDKHLPEVFALVRESARRTVNERHHDNQLIGGVIAHQGRVAELKTGEGKTLMAVLPLFLNGLSGEGAHYITTNGMLAEEGANTYAPVFHLLGASVGLVLPPDSALEERSFVYDPSYPPEGEEPADPSLPHWRPVSRKEAYMCSVTYGTHAEMGFDYLIDRQARTPREKRQREAVYAIVDEADSILIDQARTPLVRAVTIEIDEEAEAELIDMAKLADDMVRGVHYSVDLNTRKILVSEKGLKVLEEHFAGERVEDDFDRFGLLLSALEAKELYQRDDQYRVANGEIILVDESTGHNQYGMRFAEGLHQAVEAKEAKRAREAAKAGEEGAEEVRLTPYNRTLGAVSYQNLYRRYRKLAGMTGTAKSEESEFIRVYGMDVVAVPTNEPVRRIDFPDRHYKTMEQKLRDITEDIVRRHLRGQPVLVGTRSIEWSEIYASRLSPWALQKVAMIMLIRDECRISGKKMPETLRSHLRKLSWETLSEEMRKLGLNSDVFDPGNLCRLSVSLDCDEDHIRSMLQQGITHNIVNAGTAQNDSDARRILGQYSGTEGAVTIATNMAGRGVDIPLGGRGHTPEILARREHVRSLGGLHVIGTERHESRRIDDQLAGRSGRQGDPGSSCFYVSMMDDLVWRNSRRHQLEAVVRRWPDEEMRTSPRLLKVARTAQQKVEESSFGARKWTLQLDSLIERQRGVFYRERDAVLDGVDMGPVILRHLHSMVDEMTDPERFNGEEESVSRLYRHFEEYLPLSRTIPFETFRSLSAGEMNDRLHALVRSTYRKTIRKLPRILRQSLRSGASMALTELRYAETLRAYRAEMLAEQTHEIFDQAFQLSSFISIEEFREMPAKERKEKLAAIAGQIQGEQLDRVLERQSFWCGQVLDTLGVDMSVKGAYTAFDQAFRLSEHMSLEQFKEMAPEERRERLTAIVREIDSSEMVRIIRKACDQISQTADTGRLVRDVYDGLDQSFRISNYISLEEFMGLTAHERKERVDVVIAQLGGGELIRIAERQMMLGINSDMGILDDRWSDYLRAIEMEKGSLVISAGRDDPMVFFTKKTHELFERFNFDVIDALARGILTLQME